MPLTDLGDAHRTVKSPARRGFLAGSAALLLTAGLGVPAIAAPQAESLSFDFFNGVRSLKLRRTQTGELLNIDYLREGQWAAGAYEKICWMLRDTRANLPVRMDPILFAILDWTHRFLAGYGYRGAISIHSGYRTPETNRLASGARNSQHLLGKAVDFSVPGLDPIYLGRLMSLLVNGGVGVYARDDFVHIDTGTLRRWSGAVPLRG